MAGPVFEAHRTSRMASDSYREMVMDVGLACDDAAPDISVALSVGSLASALVVVGSYHAGHKDSVVGEVEDFGCRPNHDSSLVLVHLGHWWHHGGLNQTLAQALERPIVGLVGLQHQRLGIVEGERLGEQEQDVGWACLLIGRCCEEAVAEP